MQPNRTSRLASSRPLAPPPPPSSSSPSHSPSSSARLATRNDLHRALRLARRSPAARAFLLAPRAAALDLRELARRASSRAHFTIATDDDQRGPLPGRIALRYLGLPAFSDADGLSGGLVVTTYKSRTHPLHAPAVMAHVRVGRYLRDNASGDWCILTRNPRDRLTRLLYIRTSPAGARERICLTCSSDLFDRGRLLDSVLFNCHDTELRVCARCASAQCACALAPALAPVTARRPAGLAALAHTVVSEGAAEWLGTVRVTVVSNLSNNPMLNIDETMTVRSSYTPTIDSVLAAEMQRLAVIETATEATTVPYPVPNGVAAQRPRGAAGDTSDAARNSSVADARGAGRKKASSLNHAAASTAAALEMSHVSAADPTFDDVFTMEDTPEVANHFLIQQEAAISDALAETPMLPADPSTLPGGIDHCLEGMELEPEEYSYFAPSHAPRADLLNEEAVANALAGAELDDLLFPPPLDAPDKSADLESCTPVTSSAGEARQTAKPAAHIVDRPSSPQPPPQQEHEPQTHDRSAKRLKREPVDPVDTMSSLTLGSSGSASSKSPTASHASATGSPFAELSPAEHTPPPPQPQPPQQQPPAKTEDEPAATCIAAAAEAAAAAGAAAHKRKLAPASAAVSPSSAPIVNAPPVAPPAVSQTASPDLVAHPTLAPASHAPPAPAPAPAPVPVASILPFTHPPVSGMQGATAAPVAAPGLFHGAAMLGHPGPWLLAPADAAAAPVAGVPMPVPVPVPTAAGAAATAAAAAAAAAAPRLAPRPKGMPNDGFIWQMGTVPVAGNGALAFAVPAQVARWQQLERERKAEERRKKNRQAAARSNARKKDLMDGYRAQIAAEKAKLAPLREREAALRRENEKLKQRLAQL